MAVSNNPAEETWDFLLIDADPGVIRQLDDLVPAGSRSAHARSAADGEAFLRSHSIRVVVCADDLPDLPGLMLFARTRDLRPGLQRVLMCADLDADLLRHAMTEGGILHYLPKPLEAESTVHLLAHALRQSQLLETLSSTRSRLDASETRLQSAMAAREAPAPLPLRLWLFSAFGIVSVVMLVLIGFATVYLVKSALGFDFFAAMHLRDILEP